MNGRFYSKIFESTVDRLPVEVDARRGYELSKLAQTVRRVRDERLIRPLAS